jgi:hypothetical protein
MTSSTPTNTKYSRRIKWLGISVAVVAAVYSGVWFAGAAYLEQQIARGFEQSKAQGNEAECANLDIKGFPFRAGLFCDKVVMSRPSENFSVSFGALRSATQVYDPARGIVELDGPLEMKLPDGGTFSGNWSLLHASARYGSPLPKQADIEIKDMNLSLSLLDSAPLIKAGNTQVHFRTVEQDVDIASSAESLTLNPKITDDRNVPPFNFESNVRLNNGAKFLATSAQTLGQFLRGQSGTINTIGLKFVEGGGFSVSGPLSVDEAGLLSGDLSVTFTEADKLGQTVEKISPEIAAYLTPSLSAAASAAKPGENPKIDVTIRKGRAAIGIFPLGEIPPLQ